MADAPPQELAGLLNAPDPPTREAAWDAFVAAHSRLPLHTARSLNHDYDAAMDSYAFVLEALREDGHRRLRAFSADGGGKFSTWLVVVARRLCLDFRRHKYGRARDARAEGREHRAARRRLVDLVTDEIDVANLVRTETDPATDAQDRERSATLHAALQALPPRDRLLLTFRFEDGLSAREIAQVMGIATPFHVYRVEPGLSRVIAAFRAAPHENGDSVRTARHQAVRRCGTLAERAPRSRGVWCGIRPARPHRSRLCRTTCSSRCDVVPRAVSSRLYFSNIFAIVFSCMLLVPS